MSRLLILLLLAACVAGFFHKQENDDAIGLNPEEQFARERMLDLSQKDEDIEKLVDICTRWDCTDLRLSTEPGSQRTPLLYAAITGARQQMEFLLSLYFAKRPNRPDIPDTVRRSRLTRAVNAVESGKGSSVAMWAMLSKETEVVRMVLSAGADLTTKDTNGWTPLFYAAASDFAVGVDLCLEFAAKGGLELAAIVNALDTHKRTPLHVAVAQNAVSAVGKLLASNVADVSAEDERGQTAFDAAAQRPDGRQLVSQFIEALPLPNMPRHGSQDRTLLHTAAARGQTEVVRLLLEKGVEVDPLDGSKCTPLMLAATFGHPEVAKTLLDAGAKVEGEDALGHSAVMHALRSKNEQVLALLIDHGADTTALIEAVQSIVEQSLDKDTQTTIQL